MKKREIYLMLEGEDSIEALSDEFKSFLEALIGEIVLEDLEKLNSSGVVCQVATIN